MGIKDFLEEAAGAFAADKALEAVDPNAGLLEKGIAAIAGYEGVKMVKEHFDSEGEQAQPEAEAQDNSWQDQPASDEPASDDNA